MSGQDRKSADVAVIGGAWIEHGPAPRQPIGPIHWAGAETATVWNGYMDGAISSGERAAAEALAQLEA